MLVFNSLFTVLLATSVDLCRVLCKFPWTLSIEPEIKLYKVRINANFNCRISSNREERIRRAFFIRLKNESKSQRPFRDGIARLFRTGTRAFLAKGLNLVNFNNHLMRVVPHRSRKVNFLGRLRRTQFTCRPLMNDN